MPSSSPYPALEQSDFDSRVNTSAEKIHSLFELRLPLLGVDVLLVDLADFGVRRTHVKVLDKLVERTLRALSFADDLVAGQSTGDISVSGKCRGHTVPSSAFLQKPVTLRPFALSIVQALAMRLAT